MIKLTHRHTYFGPSPYATEPVVLVSLRLEGIDHAMLSSNLRQVSHHFPRWPVDPSDLEVCDDASVGRVLVSVAHWLLNDVRGLIETAASVQGNDGPLLILGFHEPQVSLLALQLSVYLLEKIGSSESSALERQVHEFGIVCSRYHPDYQARILMCAARRRDVPFLAFIRERKLWQYGWGCNSRVFMESLSNADGQIAALLAKEKTVSKAFFAALSVPTPASKQVKSELELDEAIRKIGFPCAVKPLDRGGGKGVTANVRNDEQLSRAFHYARGYTTAPVMIEQHIAGADHRLMVIAGRFVGAFRREPSFIVGDGSRTVRELIDALNHHRSASLVRSGYLRPIPWDEVLLSHLAAQQVSPDDVAPAGQRITLRSIANLSAGGIATDVSAAVHPALRDMVEQMAVSAGFGAAGFDYITQDISLPPWESGGAFIEMNTTPGLDVAIAAGWTAEQIGELVLGTEIGRIPVDLELVDELPSAASLASAENARTGSCAIVAGSHVLIGRATLKVHDTQPWGALRAALKNKSVTSAKLFCRVAEVVRFGLPVDRIAAVTLHGVTLPSAWMSLLQKHSKNIVVGSRQGNGEGRIDNDMSADSIAGHLR